MGDFNNYADVQAALDEEYRAWRDHEITGFSQKGQEARDWWANQGSSEPAPVNSTPPPPPEPAPLLPTFIPMSNVDKNFKVAPSDIIKFNNDAVGIAQIQQLLFEDIGAIELANISRSDLIDGQPVTYAPIANLSSVNRQFNPNNIIATSSSMDYFSRFGLDIFSRGIHQPYFDDNGDLIIEVDTINGEEEIQVEILINGTINTVGEA